MLRKSQFIKSEIYEDYTLKQLAEVILADAKNTMQDIEYVVDSELSDYVVPYAWFKPQSHAQCLRDISVACMGRVYVDRVGVVRVVGPTSAFE